MRINAIDLELRVRALARTYPNYIYDNPSGACSYLPDDENPLGCIVGAAAAPLGVDLEEWDQAYAIKPKDDDRIAGSPLWLSEVQHQQDQGSSWADAVAEADMMRRGY